jgi:hypothetical protein
MLKTYAKWMKGTDKATIKAIAAAMGLGSGLAVARTRTA